MARKAVERNISYDDVRQLYYVSMELGRDENGKRIKQYRTFPTLTAARNGLRDFHTQRERQAREPQEEVREEMDLAHWLEYWMESIVRPNRAETTVYAYQKIIDNHILPALGGIPMSRLSAKRIQRYYTDTQQAAGLSSNTMRRHHDLLSSALPPAVRQDMLLASPMDRVEPPRSRVKEAFFMTMRNWKQLYQLIEGHILELAVKMAGSLGMRREGDLRPGSGRTWTSAAAWSWCGRPAPPMGPPSSRRRPRTGPRCAPLYLPEEVPSCCWGGSRSGRKRNGPGRALSSTGRTM